MVVGGAGTTWRNGPHAPALVRRRGCCARSLARHSRLHARRDHLGTWATRFNAIWLLNSAKCAPIKILLAFFQLSCKLKRSTPLAAKRMLLSRCLRPALRDQVRWSLGAVRLGDLCETRFSHVRKFSGGNRRHRKRSRNRSKGNSPAAASSSSNSEVEAGTVDSPAGNSSSTTKKSPWKKTTGYKFLDWMLDLNSDETNRIRSTTEMFFTCLEPAKNPEFYEVFGIPNDGSREWFAYHNAAGLHVWLLYRRLKAEERVIESGVREGDLKSLKLFGQELFDRYWEDTLERVRETKVFEMLVNKHLRKAQEVTYANNVDLDAAIVVEDDRDTEFGGALWRTMYRSDESVPEEQIESLVNYVRAQHAKLDALTIEQVVDSQFQWDPPAAYAKK